MNHSFDFSRVTTIRGPQYLPLIFIRRTMDVGWKEPQEVFISVRIGQEASYDIAKLKLPEQDVAQRIAKKVAEVAVWDMNHHVNDDLKVEDYYGMIIQDKVIYNSSNHVGGGRFQMQVTYELFGGPAGIE